MEMGVKLGRNKRGYLLFYHLKTFYDKKVFILCMVKKKKLKKGRRKNKAMFIVKFFTQSRLEKCQMSNLEEGS